jgi:tRNA (guanosine-2'-O-)-methyltransferase
MKRQVTRHPRPPQGSKERSALFEYLSGFLTEGRKEALERVLENRTRKIVVVLDDIKQGHNMSAVLRSCDAFGVQDVHVIETIEPFEASARVALGSQKWLTIHEYDGPDAAARCVAAVQAQGFEFVGTDVPGEGSKTFSEASFDGKLAIAFGNERTGLSRTIRDACRGFLTIPIYGFVESLNISVAAAILLQHATGLLRTGVPDWGLTDAEKNDLRFDWTRTSIDAIGPIERRWYEAQANRTEPAARS